MRLKGGDVPHLIGEFEVLGARGLSQFLHMISLVMENTGNRDMFTAEQFGRALYGLQGIGR